MNKIHTVHIASLLQVKYMCVMQLKFSKTNQKIFSNMGDCPVSVFVWYLCIIVGVCVFPKTIDFMNLSFNILEMLCMDKHGHLLQYAWLIVD